MNDSSEVVDAVKRYLSLERDVVTEANISALKAMVSVCPEAFPEEFISVLFSTEDKWEFAPAKYSALAEILDALSWLPPQLRLPKSTKQVESDLDPSFTLSDTTQATVLELCARLRSSVYDCLAFDVAHRKRLLNRISAVEREVHSPKGRFDVILAGVSDFGDAAKKLGGDLKPLIDRYLEIVTLTRRETKEYDQLPPPDEVKKLPPPDKE